VVAREVAHRAGKEARVLGRDADGDAAQALEADRVEAADRTEVEQPDRARGVDEQVPRVRIGVVQAVGEDLAEDAR
jgi:hypothetical protein